MTRYDFAKQILDAQPFSQLLGAEILEVSENGASFALDLAAKHRQQHGIAHGGVLAAMADIALAFAGGLAMGSDAVTSEFKINYIRAVRGTRLIARGETLGMTKRQATVQARLDCDGTLVCVAQGTIMRV
ncbi:PaaI family thioesterase [Gymnodinialimonas sp. 2305UL16-5]|uniref:PaaI family thioesterase n=1 Tax=Gymnodinialimonas mytili TaxID=3126503 RepID=UPI0030A40D58